MQKKFSRTIALIQKGIGEGVFPGVALVVGDRQGELLRYVQGNRSIYPIKEPLEEDSLFDLASLTKLVSTTMIALKFIEEGKLSLQDTIDTFFEAPVDKKLITIKQLMTHTGGFKSTFRLDQRSKSNKECIKLILEEPLEIKPGENVIYSCMGYILLGKILEQVGGTGLDILSREYVFNPLEMSHTSYKPHTPNVAATEYDAETKTYLKGVVHDENARFLEGISGNAGVFSNIDDLSKFARMLANQGVYKEHIYLAPSVFEASIRNNTAGMNEHRGLGFSLKDEQSHPAGDLFAKGSFGHTGFTGTSLWIEKKSGLYVVLLTNRVHPSRENTGIIRFRRLLHNVILTEYEA